MPQHKKKHRRRHTCPSPKDSHVKNDEILEDGQSTVVAHKTLFDVPDAAAVVSENEEKSDDEKIKYNPDLAIPVVMSGTDRYDKSRTYTGSAIIFNMEDFQNFKKYTKREGSQVDVDRLNTVFQKLNIDIQDRVYKNCSYNSMRIKLKDFLSDPDLLSQSNALFVIILTHGLADDKLMATDTDFHLYDFIKMFTLEELKLMATRPKIFIIQACRGDEIDSGSILKPAKFTTDCADSVPDEEPFKYPSHADLCVALSSHHGHFSYRNAEGSWFVQSLCDVLENIDLNDNHFLDILTATNEKVATRSTVSDDVRFEDKKQISSFYTTFTKKFYLKKE